jgi:hypothetical protein
MGDPDPDQAIYLSADLDPGFTVTVIQNVRCTFLLYIFLKFPIQK